MTFRQSEFARHYAQGKPATQAALAAGYTKSTAETNAARLLKSPQIINEIRVNRNGLRIVTIDDITRTMTRLMHIIDNSDNYAHVLQASAQLFRYLRFQPDVWPEYPDKLDNSDKTADIPELDDEIDQTPEIIPQPAPTPCRGELHSPVPPPEPPLSETIAPTLDNPDKKSINYPLSTINSPLTPEFLESIDDPYLADIVRQNPIMGRVLAHKYSTKPDPEDEPAYA